MDKQAENKVRTMVAEIESKLARIKKILGPDDDGTDEPIPDTSEEFT